LGSIIAIVKESRMAEDARQGKANLEKAKTKEAVAAEAEPAAVRAEELGPQEHDVTLSIVNPPAEANPSSSMAVQARVSCSSGCDLRGQIVKIVAQDAVVVKETYLTQFYGVNDSDVIITKAPIEPGEYTWTAVFPAQQKGRVLHQQSSAPFSFVVMPQHATSMAVWDVPSPIPVGERFRVKVGVKCAADCELTDQRIEVYDHEGIKVASARLGDVRRPDMDALHCAEVELESPGAEAYYTWEVRFPEPDLETPHEAASHAFGFSAGKPAEHVVTVQVVDKHAQTPIKGADVLLHPYRGHTDERGMAMLMVPKGEYALYVSKNKYKTLQTIVQAASDVAVKAELLPVTVSDNDG
jgi:hypothetical protein